jgi:hypothetical protein
VIDPFTQQVVQASACPTADPKAQVSIPRTILYSELGEHITAGFDALNAGMQSAIYAGVYDADIVTIPFDCGTGNCTFEEHYSSLGHCSGCVDLTPDLKVTTSTGYNGSDNETAAYSIFHTTLPSGLRSVYSAGCEGSRYCEFDNGTLFVMGNVGYEGESVFTYASVQMILEDTSAPGVGLKDCSATGFQRSESWSCMKPGSGAAQCNLHPCVRTYKDSIVGGKLMEDVISTSPPSGRSRDIGLFLDTVRVDCLSDQGTPIPGQSKDTTSQRKLRGYHTTRHSSTAPNGMASLQTAWSPKNASTSLIHNPLGM